MSNKINDIDVVAQENDGDKMVEALRAKLEWYTKEATEEEFDPKAVESILYLMDIYEPLEEQFVNVDDAWARFEKRSGTQSIDGKAQKEDGSDENEAGELQGVLQRKQSSGKSSANVVSFIRKQKIVVAAVLVILLLALVGTTQAEAIRQNGFFFWLRQDESGRQMITSPESLESTLDDVYGNTYDDRDAVPAWCKELLGEEANLEEDENLEWKYINTVQMSNYNVVKSCYTDLFEREVIVGVVSYAEKVTISTELFEEYSYVQCYGEKQNIRYLYNRVEESGRISYCICGVEENNIFFVEGTDLETLKRVAEKILEK